MLYIRRCGHQTVLFGVVDHFGPLRLVGGDVLYQNEDRTEETHRILNTSHVGILRKITLPLVLATFSLH